MGFISYVPKYVTEPRNFVDPKKNEFMHDDAHHVIFRAYVSFRTGYKLLLEDKYGKQLIEYPDEYTWRHVGVFESLLKKPD